MEPWIWAVLLLVLGIGLAILEIFFASAGILAFLAAAAMVAAFGWVSSKALWREP